MDNLFDDHHQVIPTELVTLDKSMKASNRYLHHQRQQQQQHQHMPPSHIRDEQELLLQFLQKLQDDVGTFQENLEYYETMVQNRFPSHHIPSSHMDVLDNQEGMNPPEALNGGEYVNNNGINHDNNNNDNHGNGMSTTQQEDTTTSPPRSLESIVTHPPYAWNSLPEERMVLIFCKYLDIRTLIVEKKPYLLSEGMMVNIISYLDVRSLVEIKLVCRQWKTLSTTVINAKGIGTTRKAFETNEELRNAVRRYCPLPQGCIDAQGDIDENTTQQYCNREIAEKIACTYGWPINKWDVSKIEHFSEIFRGESPVEEVNGGVSLFNEDISSWDVSKAIKMNHMFCYARKFNQDISLWDVSNVTSMDSMFDGAEEFNQDLSKWDVSEVKDMTYLFCDATSFNGNISTWNVSNLQMMMGMFQNATSFNGNISGWDVSNVNTMDDLFIDAAQFDQDLSSWDISLALNTLGDMEFAFERSPMAGQWTYNQETERLVRNNNE